MPERLKFWIIAILSAILMAGVVAHIIRGETVIGWSEIVLLVLILAFGVGGMLHVPDQLGNDRPTDDRKAR